MKTKRKPDLLVVLTFIVGFGILYSAFSDDPFTPTQNITINTSSLDPSVRLPNLYQGDFVNVTHAVRVTADKKAADQPQQPNKYLP